MRDMDTELDDGTVGIDYDNEVGGFFEPVFTNSGYT
jgi:hypothetical protein